MIITTQIHHGFRGENWKFTTARLWCHYLVLFFPNLEIIDCASLMSLFGTICYWQVSHGCAGVRDLASKVIELRCQLHDGPLPDRNLGTYIHVFVHRRWQEQIVRSHSYRYVLTILYVKPQSTFGPSPHRSTCNYNLEHDKSFRLQLPRHTMPCLAIHIQWRQESPVHW
jgi:hypothetical protein